MERPDSRRPRVRSRRWEVLAGEPERAVVPWVETEVAVVTPARTAVRRQSGLRPAAGRDRPLAEWQEAGPVGRRAAGVAERRERRGARDAVAEGNVAELVERGAPHPAGVAVRCVRPRLEQRRRAARDPPELVPTDPRLIRADADRLVDEQRVVVAEVAIREPEHQLVVVERIERRSAARLRNAAVVRVRAHDPLVLRDRNRGGTGETARPAPVGLELVEPQSVE